MIKSLQGLRALGMIGIFLFHSGLLLKGTFPVTFFFILSGFVIYYSCSFKIVKFDIKDNIRWIGNRMKKLYPIHLITFIMSVIIRFNWILKFSIGTIVIKALLNLSLLQSLDKNQTFPFNGLSWFLSTTFILYVMAIPLILQIKKLNKIKPEYLILIILIIQNIVIFINNKQNYQLNLYTSPFFRVLDFSIGMLIAKSFIVHRNNKFDNKIFNNLEVGIVIAFFVMYVVSLFNDNIEYGLSFYSPVFIVGIYVFAFEKGNISKWLSQDIFQKIASFSFEFYMVHELILIVFRNIFVNFNIHWIIKCIVIAIPSFIISIILAILLNKYVTKNKFIFSINKDKKLA